MSASELTGFKYEEKGLKLQMSKGDGEVKVVAAPAAPLPAAPLPAGPAPVPVAEAPAPLKEETEEAAKPGKVVESPLVGTFYAAPAEDAEPFVTVGSAVKKGQTLAIVEAMKLMNEIESDYDVRRHRRGDPGGKRPAGRVRPAPFPDLLEEVV